VLRKEIWFGQSKKVFIFKGVFCNSRIKDAVVGNVSCFSLRQDLKDLPVCPMYDLPQV
jgi:hypothetical protein